MASPRPSLAWEQLPLYAPTAVRLDLTITIETNPDRITCGYWAFDLPEDHRIGGAVRGFDWTDADRLELAAWLEEMIRTAAARVIPFP